MHDHGVVLPWNLQFIGLFDKTIGIFGTGQFLVKGVQTETVMNTLIQDAAPDVIPF